MKKNIVNELREWKKTRNSLYIPGEYDDITKEEYEKAVKIAKDCLAWVEKKVSAIETADTTPIGGIINKEQ